MRQDSHRGDVVHAVRRNVALLVAIEPVEGGPVPWVGTGSPAARGVAQPEGGETGCLGAPPAVGADCTGAVGGGLAYPLHAASPHGVLRVPHAGDRVRTSRNRGVHPSLVCPRQGAGHVAESPPGPRQHDGVGVAGAMPTPAGGERWSTAGTSGMTAVARRVTCRFPRLPLFPPITTHLHTARALHTQPSRLPVPVGRYPGHCILVTAPSAHHIASHHIVSHHITAQHIASHRITSHHIVSYRIASHRIASRHSTQHSTAQHSTAQHITSHHITSHHITSHHITSHHITSHHITSNPHSAPPSLPPSLWFSGRRSTKSLSEGEGSGAALCAHSHRSRPSLRTTTTYWGSSTACCPQTRGASCWPAA